jgi:glycosyltransferase involved in cell wall biosynthesis
LAHSRVRHVLAPGERDGLVTVIVPTFNRADVIERALVSIASQSYTPLEIVVVDDGSTDATREVVERFAASSALPVRYEHQANSGCAAARNAGLATARGEMIAFLDSDDAWTPAALEAMVGALRTNQADFVYSPAIEVRAGWPDRLNPPVAAGRPTALASEHFGLTNLRTGAFLFHRRVLERVAGLDTSLRHSEDSDFVQRVAITSRAAYTPHPTVRVFHHESNKSQDRLAINLALLRSAEQILAEYPEFAQKLGAAAPRRLRRLRIACVESFIHASDFERAAALAAVPGLRLPPAHRVALWVRSAWPLRVARFVQIVRNKLGLVKRRLRRMGLPPAAAERRQSPR